MKTASMVLAVCLGWMGRAEGFSVTPTSIVTRHTVGRDNVHAMDAFRMPSFLKDSSTTVEQKSKEIATENDNRSIYEKIGISKDDLAMGVNPEEVYSWVGTREDMIEKTMQDIPNFGRTKAEEEVAKFMKDPEMMNYYIEFRKRLAENPNMIQPEEKEGFFSFRTVVGLYIAYVAWDVVYTNFLKDKIPLDSLPSLPGIGGGGGGGADAVASSADAIQGAAATAVDAVSFFM